VLETQLNITECTDLACTLEFIPAACETRPILVQNGTECLGCPEWKPKCRTQADDSNTASASVENKQFEKIKDFSSCPVLDCAALDIPAECILRESYDVNGTKCYKCPSVKPGCTAGAVTGVGTMALEKCPVMRCTMEFIPEECREIPKIDVGGLLCDGCPRRKPECQTTKSEALQVEPNVVSTRPRRACGLIVCRAFIPDECKEKRNFTDNQGQVCQLCPTWRAGCREEERQVFLTLPEGAVPDSCPQIECSEIIAPACQVPQPYTFLGRTCYKCPQRKENCPFVSPNGPASIVQPLPQIGCPVFRCQALPAINENCFEKSFFNFQGLQCEGCLVVKNECKDLVQPRGQASIDSSKFESQEAVQCPPVPCTRIYIHPVCREETTFLHNGRMCPGCPVAKADCVPPTDTALVTKAPRVVCPLKACALLLIPPECREEQPYQYQGITCFECPKWRDGCQTENRPPVEPSVPEMSCPLHACPKIYIPPDCRDEQLYEHRGKTCQRCPVWREGCVPKPVTFFGSSTPPPVDVQSECPMLKCKAVDAPAECIVSTTVKINGRTCPDCPNVIPNCLDQKPSPEPCPAIPCPAIFIPPECRLEQPYDYKGQTCYMCPRWKPECTSSVPDSEVGFRSGSLGGSEPQTIADLQTGFPMNDLRAWIDSLVCPPLPCPYLLIPPQCREETTYVYNGIRCKGCPRWQLSCQTATTSGSTVNG